MQSLDESGNLKIKQQKLPILNNIDKIEQQRKKRDLGNCGTTTKDLTFMSSDSRKEKNKREEMKRYSKK